MASGERFSGYPAQFGYATAQTMDLAQVQGWDFDANVTETPFVPAGATKPTQVITSRGRPEFRLRTQDIATVLGVVDFNTGRCFDESSTFAVQERTDCNTFESGDTHPVRTTANGFMFVESITVDQDSEIGAIMTMRYIPLKASGTDIVVYDTFDLATTPNITPAYTSSFFLYSPYHNSSELKGVQSVTINTGIQFQPAPSSPGAFDTLGSIVRYEPEFTFRSLKVDDFDAYKATGIPVNTSFAFYFQKADATNAAVDGRVALATAQHVKLSFTGGKITVRNLSFEGTDDAGVEVSVRPTGTVTASITSAIP